MDLKKHRLRNCPAEVESSFAVLSIALKDEPAIRDVQASSSPPIQRIYIHFHCSMGPVALPPTAELEQCV